jgi:hypothetical protein
MAFSAFRRRYYPLPEKRVLGLPSGRQRGHKPSRRPTLLWIAMPPRPLAETYDRLPASDAHALRSSLRWQKTTRKRRAGQDVGQCSDKHSREK